MRTLLALLALSLTACGASSTGGDASVVTELPDGAACPSGTQFCGGTVCVAFDHARNCGACGVTCRASAPSCELRSGAYLCVP